MDQFVGQFQKLHAERSWQKLGEHCRRGITDILLLPANLPTLENALQALSLPDGTGAILSILYAKTSAGQFDWDVLVTQVDEFISAQVEMDHIRSMPDVCK